MPQLTPKLRDAFADGYNRIRSGELKTLIPYLCLFRLNGKPMNLRLHYQLAPMYATVQPSHSLYMLARQLGKSYATCSSMGLRNMLIPFYHTVLIQPRADQIQRLISTVYKPLMNSCPIIDEFISSTERTKLALREFRSGSMCYAEHMFESADRIRGISGAASVSVDECTFSEEFAFVCNMNTLQIERKKISEILAGDIVVSFDKTKTSAILYSVVQRDASYRGLRPCYKITTRSGKTLICTAGHALQTNHGKMRLEEIVQYEHSHRTSSSRGNDGTPVECHHGQSSGGCGIRLRGTADNVDPLEPFVEAGPICPEQVPDIARVRYQTTCDQAESRLRGLLVDLNTQIPWSISLLACDDAPERLQAEIHNLGILDHDAPSNSTGVVVHGRRQQSKGVQPGESMDQRVHTGGSVPSGELAERLVAYSGRCEESETQFDGKDCLGHLSSDRGLRPSVRTGGTVCTGVHEVQTDTGVHNVSSLRQSDAAVPQAMLLSQMCGNLPQDGQTALLRAASGSLQAEVQGVESCTQGRDQRCCQGALRESLGRKETGASGVCQHVASPQGRGVPGAQTCLSCRHEERPGIPAQAQGRTCEIFPEVESRPGTLCQTSGTCQESESHGFVSGKEQDISAQSPHGETCERPGNPEEVPGAHGAPCGTGSDDRGGTHCVLPGVSPQTVPEETGANDSGRARRVQGETERVIRRTLGEQNPGTARQDQSIPEKDARQLDTGDQGQESGAEEDLLRAQDGGDQGRPGEVRCLPSESPRGLSEAKSGESSQTGTAGIFLLDPIVSVEYVGELPVYDIEVVGTHNFVMANGICSYNCQDIEFEFLDIAAEVMSASLFWGFSIYTGTPKTTDTTLGLLWNRSSQAEWVIKCLHCGHYNIPNPENDIVGMIGKHGPICVKCGKDIHPQNGGWVHAVPELMTTFPGYHLSQSVHPLHMINQHKWNQLLAKVNSYDQQTLYNEVFGWPYDAATSPLTLADLQKATFTPKDENGFEVDVQTPDDVLRVRWQYRFITIGVDWSGGGMISDSFTAYAVLGLRRDCDVIDVLYGKRIPKGATPTEEADEILYWLRGTGADAFAYDNHGAGFARLEIMKHQGLHSLQKQLYITPMDYVRPHSGDVMQKRDAMREPDMYYFNIDKSRSLAICVQSIKSNRIRFKPFKPEDEQAYQRDFLALREDPRKSLGNETVILIIKKPGVPDDFAHAVNFGCSQIWDHYGAYPAIGTRYDASILDFDEYHQPIMPDEQFGPRSDWERFEDAVNLRASIVESDMPY